MKKIILMVAALGFLAAEGPALAAGTNAISVSATVIGTCKFSAATSTLAFGNLDPTLATNATASLSTNFWCTKGAAYTITNDSGLHNSGATIRMQNATDLTQFIPYTIAYTNTGTGSGKNTPITLNVTGTVLNADYVDAGAGNYADTLTLTVNP
jgi:spore coat protein U domain-containing protein, fimbrial subunit CupE1/2/3/6